MSASAPVSDDIRRAKAEADCLYTGEEVAAALVLKEGASATESEIRSFVASRLADFKVPRKVLFLVEIPKGATGKAQRIGLADKLGLSA